MHLSRRAVLKGLGTLPLAAGNFGFSAFAQAPPAAPSATEVPPILFVHGNGDYAALWITTLWRMESSGVPRDRMFAINFTDPLARTDDSVPQPNRSSTEDQRRELGEAVTELKRRTGASRVALVGNSRGGNSTAVISKPAELKMSATPCCAAFPTTASTIGTMVSATNSTAAGRFCADS